MLEGIVRPPFVVLSGVSGLDDSGFGVKVGLVARGGVSSRKVNTFAV